MFPENLITLMELGAKKQRGYFKRSLICILQLLWSLTSISRQYIWNHDPFTLMDRDRLYFEVARKKTIRKGRGVRTIWS